MSDTPRPENSGGERPEWALLARALWREPVPPRLDQLLTAAVLADEEALADVLAVDTDERRRRGSPLRMRAYLDAAPEIADRPAARRVLLMAELTAVDPADPVSRHQRALQLEAEFPAFAEDVRAVESLAAMLGDAVATPAPRVAGARLGKYELISLLGTGAFAETWRARDVVLQREIALKVVRRTYLDDETGRASERFFAEARAAAGLEHPAVVRIHEAGRFPETGEFYLDMQLVGGGKARTLDELVVTGAIPAVRAAELVAALARGLAAAHARGVTHRDIKPTNILLDAQDRPLLADFGLAETMSVVPSAGSENREGAGPRIAGTPAYIAPEVARGEGSTPLADIFSLGATLRALLTGREPRANGDSSARVLAMARTQPLPSLAGTGVPATLAAIADRATAMSPADRYASADRFAEDLDAFLHYRPTSARPPGVIGAGRLWVRRNRRVAMVLAASVVVLGVMSAGFAVRLERERDRAREAERQATLERDAAIAAREIIETQNVFVTRSFNSARGQRSDGALSVKEAIALAARRAPLAFPDRPLVEAAVCHFLGQAAIGAAEFGQAHAALDRALALRTEHLGLNHPDTISTRRVIADLLQFERKLDQSKVMYDEIVRAVRGTPMEYNSDGLWCQVAVARRNARTGDKVQYLAELERLANIYRSQPFRGGMDHQQALNELVTLYGDTNNFAQAAAVQKEIIALLTNRLGVDDISTLNATQALGWVYRGWNKDEQAAQVYRDVLEQYRRVVGEKHHAFQHVAIELSSLEAANDPARAVALASEAVNGSAAQSPSSQYRLRAAIALGKALVAHGRDDEAERVLRDALDACVKHRGPRHVYSRDAATVLALLLDRQGRKDEAATVRAVVSPADPPAPPGAASPTKPADPAEPSPD